MKAAFLTYPTYFQPAYTDKTVTKLWFDYRTSWNKLHTVVAKEKMDRAIAKFKI